MNRIFVVVMVVLLLPCGLSGPVYGESVSSAEETTPSMVTTPPDSVAQSFFNFLQDGKATEAQELFLIRNPEQEGAVSKHVSGGIAFFGSQPISSRVVGAFVDDRFAVCAIEQTSANHPGKFELESGCLMLENGQWRLLPMAQDHRAGLNGLSLEEKAAFDKLQKEFSIFKQGFRK